MLIKSFPIRCVDLLVMPIEAVFNAINGKEQVIFRKNQLFFEFATNCSSIKTENNLKRREMYHSEFTINNGQLSINVAVS